MKQELIVCVLTVVVMSTLIQARHVSSYRAERYKKFLCSYWYNWPWVLTVEKTDPIDRIPQVRTLVGSCEADVGTCPVGSCSTYRKFSPFCPDNGYICAETEPRIQDCGVFGGIEYKYVKSCGCCIDFGVVVKGVVKDQVTKEPVGRVILYFNRRKATRTGGNGMFKTTIKSNVRRVVITTRSKNYLQAVKVVDIPEGFRGPLEVEIFIMKRAEPVTFDSTINRVLSLSNNPLDPEAGHTNVEIKANSFTDRQGRPFRGSVNARVTFIDTENNPDTVAPGIFQTSVENSVEPLITDGVFSFNFESVDGKPIKLSAPVKVSAREGMRVWRLNSFTGLWDLVKGASPTRGKRQVSIDDILSIESDRWYNIDKIPGAPRCYFKGRIFDEMSGLEITSSSTATFRPEITAYTSIGQRLRLYAGYTAEPNTTCYEVRCPMVSNPNNSLAGFINMSATEAVSIGGINFPTVTYLTPRDLVDYDATLIQPKLSDVQYEVAPNGLDIFANFVSDIAGPFYRNKNKCESSTITQPAFHFFKPELPSYEPVPDDTDICTARIAFRDRYNFYNYVSNLTNLPNVTGVSIWEDEDGTKFYYTDVAQMNLYTDGGNTTFVSICLKYRCSQENDLTTIYIDIDIPVVNVTYNRTFPNGTVITYTYQQQEFHCYGERAEKAQITEGSDIATIEGSFIAQEDVAAGPDYYDTETNDCRQETNSETFAYELFCNSKQRGDVA